jgi:hypothetical protein
VDRRLEASINKGTEVPREQSQCMGISVQPVLEQDEGKAQQDKWIQAIKE